jgi:recombinational DNA repair ATPase RecF
MTDDDTMALLARVRWLEAENQRLIEHAAQAEADRDVMAAALRAWIKHYEDGLFGDEDWTRLKRLTNAARLAMARAKEAK